MEACCVMQFQSFSDLMNQRRAIRVFDGSPIPENIMRECLQLTLLTPSSSNLMPYEFYWVRNPDLRPAIVQAFISQSAARTASEIVVVVARTGTWDKNRRDVLNALKSFGRSVTPQNLDYYERVVPDVYNQGRFGWRGFMKRCLNSIFGLKRAIIRAPASHAQMRIWAIKSASMACQSLILAFQAHGLDTCPMEGLDSKRIGKILDLPSDATVVMGIAVGTRSYNGIVSPRIRLPESRFIKEI
jgi:nitroreductase